VRSPTPPTPAGVGDNDRPEDENAKQLATPGEPNCNSNQQVKAIENSKSNKAVAIVTTGAVPANQPISDGEATDRCKSLRRKMADCPSK